MPMKYVLNNSALENKVNIKYSLKKKKRKI